MRSAQVSLDLHSLKSTYIYGIAWGGPFLYSLNQQADYMAHCKGDDNAHHPQLHLLLFLMLKKYGSFVF